MYSLSIYVFPSLIILNVINLPLTGVYDIMGVTVELSKSKHISVGNDADPPDNVVSAVSFGVSESTTIDILKESVVFGCGVPVVAKFITLISLTHVWITNDVVHNSNM